MSESRIGGKPVIGEQVYRPGFGRASLFIVSV